MELQPFMHRVAVRDTSGRSAPARQHHALHLGPTELRAQEALARRRGRRLRPLFGHEILHGYDPLEVRLPHLLEHVVGGERGVALACDRLEAQGCSVRSSVCTRGRSCCIGSQP